MLNSEDAAGETAISYTDQFLDGAVAKLDKLFGKGYAKENPALVQAYLAACAANLSAFIQSAVAIQSLGELLDDDSIEN